MAIKLLPLTLDDSEAMVDLNLATFVNDNLMRVQYALDTSTPEQYAEYRDWRIRRANAALETSSNHWFKAVDDSTTALVGYAGVYPPDVKPPKHFATVMPAHFNKKLIDSIVAKMEELKKRYVGNRNDVWYVQAMAVHPDYQGRGVAKQLLRRALQGADEAEQDVYLEATPAGRPLYERLGFEALEEYEFDSVLDYKMVAMMRRFRRQSGSTV